MYPLSNQQSTQLPLVSTSFISLLLIPKRLSSSDLFLSYLSISLSMYVVLCPYVCLLFSVAATVNFPFLFYYLYLTSEFITLKYTHSSSHAHTHTHTHIRNHTHKHTQTHTHTHVHACHLSFLHHPYITSLCAVLFLIRWHTLRHSERRYQGNTCLHGLQQLSGVSILPDHVQPRRRAWMCCISACWLLQCDRQRLMVSDAWLTWAHMGQLTAIMLLWIIDLSK